MRSTRKSSSGSAAGYHGSSLRELGAPLDQERAASMADEGGVSGAHTDALMQTRVMPQRREQSQRDLRRILPWAMLVSGVAAGLVAAVWAWRRSQSY